MSHSSACFLIFVALPHSFLPLSYPLFPIFLGLLFVPPPPLVPSFPLLLLLLNFRYRSSTSEHNVVVYKASDVHYDLRHSKCSSSLEHPRLRKLQVWQAGLIPWCNLSSVCVCVCVCVCARRSLLVTMATKSGSRYLMAALKEHKQV